DQVKIRGFRIEPGEVEAALGEQPGVRDVAVLAQHDRMTGDRLVAYVVLAAGATPTAVRDALAARLPAFMVPSAFVTLDALPLTANGKVDRRALEAAPVPVASSSYIAPRDDLEATLVRIWQEVLGIERIG